MYKTLIYICVFLHMLHGVQAQDPDTLLPRPRIHLFSADTIFKKHLELQFGWRRSFVRSSPVRIHGLNISYIISPKFALGTGLYKINEDYFTKSRRGTFADISNNISLYYATPNVTYTFFESRWLRLNIPLEVGYGMAVYNRTDQANGKTKRIKENLVPVQLGLGGVFKFNRWIQFQTSAGYRYIALQSKDAVFKNMFNGWYYTFSVQVVLRNIAGDLMYWHRYRKQQRILIEQ